MKLAIRFDACAACDEVLETGFWFCQFHQVFSRRLSETPEAFLFFRTIALNRHDFTFYVLRFLEK
jgi:hypothetical protein